MNIDLVIFDMAGTTVLDGDAVNQCLREALAAAGREVSQVDLSEVMGLAKPEAVRRLIEQTCDSEQLPERVTTIYADFMRRLTRYYQSDPAVSEVPGANDVFQRLKKRRIRVALDSGLPRVAVNSMLTRLGWDKSELIDATVASDEVKRGRPHPDMIQHLMKKVLVRDARRVAKVGDTPVDLLEGANAGCEMVIGVTSGTHSREQLEHFPHSHLLESVAELPALLGI